MNPPDMMNQPQTEPPKTELSVTPVPAPPSTPSPAETPDPVLTDEEKSEWSKSVESLKKSLGQQDFETSKKQLEELTKTARTRVQHEQLKRLATAAKLIEEFRENLVNAVAGLGAGETFKFGNSSVASFIEGRADGLTVKLAGRIQALKFTELPMGLASGLADLQMDIQHPLSYARKSAFAWVHPKTNPLAIKEAKKMMDKAISAKAVADDMGKIFDDDYTLTE
jgi:hypothetical protein